MDPLEMLSFADKSMFYWLNSLGIKLMLHELGVSWKQSLYLYGGRGRSAYVSPSPDPTCCGTTLGLLLFFSFFFNVFLSFFSTSLSLVVGQGAAFDQRLCLWSWHDLALTQHCISRSIFEVLASFSLCLVFEDILIWHTDLTWIEMQSGRCLALNHSPNRVYQLTWASSNTMSLLLNIHSAYH